MSMFPTPISNSVAGAGAAEHAASREVNRKAPQSGGRTRTVADSVEILIESPEGVEPASPGANDLKQRQPRDEKHRKQTPRPGEDATDSEKPRLDLQA